ncbi:MAG: LptF/LptG family permease [Treponemataceae bacterium]
MFRKKRSSVKIKNIEEEVSQTADTATQSASSDATPSNKEPKITFKEKYQKIYAACFEFKRQQGLKNVLFVYIFKELLLYFSIAFLFFFMIFFVNQILLMAENILKKRVPGLAVFQLIIYSLPFIIAQSAPFATLVGFLMCLGRMATDNEVLVIRALGSSYTVFLWPVLLLGLFISIASFGVNDYLLPRGSLAYNRLYTEILLSNPGIELESFSIKRTQNSVLVIGLVKDKTVSDLVYFDVDDKNNQRIITARQTDILQAQNQAVLMQLSMSDAQMMLFENRQKENFDFISSYKTIMNVFASDFFPSNSSELSPREKTSIDLRKDILSLRQRRAAGEEVRVQLNIYELEYYKKFSLPFGSIFFAFMAMPLSIVFGKHNGQAVGLIIGVLICVVYWAMLIIGQTFGFRSGFSGFWSMWLPNLLVFVVGSGFYFGLIKR